MVILTFKGLGDKQKTSQSKSQACTDYELDETHNVDDPEVSGVHVPSVPLSVVVDTQAKASDSCSSHCPTSHARSSTHARI